MEKYTKQERESLINREHRLNIKMSTAEEREEYALIAIDAMIENLIEKRELIAKQSVMLNKDIDIYDFGEITLISTKSKLHTNFCIKPRNNDIHNVCINFAVEMTRVLLTKNYKRG